MDDTRTYTIIADILVSAVGIGVLVAAGIAVAAIIAAYLRPVTSLDPATAPETGTGSTADPAWPNYFRCQWQLDAEIFRSTVLRLYRAGYDRWWAKFPVFVVGWPVLFAAGLFLGFLSAIVFVACGVVRIAGELAYWFTVAGIRLADLLHAKSRRAEASCPTCFEVMDRPAYTCPGCGVLHRDIRPGRRGSIYRACVCGHRLPTGVLRAAWTLDAVCQHCGAAVHHGAAVLQDVRVPVFGEPHAGKTRLIYAGFRHLIALAETHDVPVTFPDDSSRDRAEAGLRQIAGDQRTTKTDWALERPLTCQLGTGIRGALLHVFDAAGERFRGAGGHDDLHYLNDGHTLVFAVDPFAIPGLRQFMAGLKASELRDEHMPVYPRNPEEAYGEVVSRIRTAGAETKRQRLAIVVTKADILAVLDVETPEDSEGVKTWLYENGMHNVVLAAEREFKEVRYFAVASVGTPDPAETRHRAEAPFLWALTSRGFTGLGPSSTSGATPVRDESEAVV